MKTKTVISILSIAIAVVGVYLIEWQGSVSVGVLLLIWSNNLSNGNRDNKGGIAKGNGTYKAGER